MPAPHILTPQEHTTAALDLLTKAAPLPLAATQRLALLAEAQVHASLAVAASSCPAAAPKPAARKAKAKPAAPVVSEAADNA